ncbi:MAG: hypothetical protein ABJL99_22505 [Aliishimia sp.]
MSYVGLSGIFGPDGYALANAKQDDGLYFADVPEPNSADLLPLSTQSSDFRAVEDQT